MRKLTIATWAAVGIIGAACGDDIVDQPDDDPPPAVQQDTRPTCPGVAWSSPEERCFTIQTFVESRLGPYDVYVRIEGGEGAYPPHVPIAGGGWSHGVKYATGKKLHVAITLHYEGAPSADGFCSITDGQTVLKEKLKSVRAKGGSPYEAFCELAATTQ